MHGRKPTSALDPEFLTIYFMRGTQLDRKVALRRVWVIFGVLVIMFGFIGLRVWQEMQVVKVGYELHRLKQQRVRLLEEQQLLQTQRNALASLDRVETVARTSLGMTTPGKDQTVFVVEVPEAPRGLSRVWSTSQSWLDKTMTSWRSMWGRSNDKNKEARLGG